MSEIAIREDLKAAQLDNFNNVGDIMTTADILIKSKMIPSSFKKPEEVVTVVMKGREIGLPAIASLENIYYIQGRATTSINVLIALASKAGVALQTVKDFEPVYTWVDADGKPVDPVDPPKGSVKKLTDYVTTVRIMRHVKAIDRVVENDVSFTWSEAKAMGLTSKDNWVKQKQNMTWVRCASRAIRRFAADAILGMYETSEMADSSNVKYEMDEDNNAKIIID